MTAATKTDQPSAENTTAGPRASSSGMAGGLLGHAAEPLADGRVTDSELRCLASRLSQSLRDVKRVADSRGARLKQGES